MSGNMSPNQFLKPGGVRVSGPGFPPPEKLPSPDPVESPTKRIAKWVGDVPNSPSAFSPPPQGLSSSLYELEEEKKAYNKTFTQTRFSTSSSDLPANSNNMSSPFEMKIDELAEPLKEIARKEERENREIERIERIREGWKEQGMPLPEDWPKLKFVENYDEDPGVQANLRLVTEEFRAFKASQLGVDEEGNVENHLEKELQEADQVIQQNASEDNRFEASELIEYKNHEWCIALRIDREKVDSVGGFQLLIYSYKRGIERLPLSASQIDALGTTLLIKYRTKPDKSIECVPIYSALPSTGLVSLKYRTNKGIELRVYGIINFVDFIRDPDHMMHKTMIWTDAIGPIYLTSAERTNMRRKIMQTEEKIFAPLRMCQLVVKGEFTTTVPNGSMLKWTIASFSPLIEEKPKDPNIGRNLWPARIIRMDDLIFKMKIEPKEVNHHKRQAKYLQNHAGGGTLLTSASDLTFRVFCGPHLTGILNSAGPTYYANGVMTAYIVPYYQNREFVFFEALIAGPPRVIMLITEGRYLNYTPKTWPPSVQKAGDGCRKVVEAAKEEVKERPHVRPPCHYSTPSSLLGFKEMIFDF